MKLLRFVSRACLVISWALGGLLCVALAYPFLGHPARAEINRCWSRRLMRMSGIRILPAGEPILDGPVLWVANHVSWVDIYAVNTVRATSFVAKAEISSWPLIGWLAKGADTIFIDRSQRHAVHAVSDAVQERFARGAAVGLFPEGTTSEGFNLRPFHASLFEPARAAGVAIQPVVLRFLKDGKRDSFAAFIGEESLAGNMWRVLGATGLAVEVEFLPVVNPAGAEPSSAAPTRLELSHAAREAIAARL